MAVSMGRDSSYVVTNEGNLYSFGNNACGQMGLRHWREQTEPEQINFTALLAPGETISMVSGGYRHAACVTTQGSVFTWGHNTFGVLGMGCAIPMSAVSAPFKMYTPLQIQSRAVQVACGTSFTLVLTEAGQVLGCGRGDRGQLGHGDRLHCHVLFPIDKALFGGREIGMIAAGNAHSMAISREPGMFWTWGEDEFGQLGHGNLHEKTSVSTPTPPANFLDNSPEAVGDSVVSMDGGEDFTVVVTAGGVLWSCGSGSYGKTGLGTTDQQNSLQRVGGPEIFGGKGVRMATCGNLHTLIVAWDNSLWICGHANSSLMISQHFADMLRPHRVDDEVFLGGGVLVAAAGATHSCAVTPAGVLYTWGRRYNSEDSAGLGFAGVRSLVTPRAHDAGSFGGSRVGRWHDVSRERVLALAMATHRRLGASSAACEFPEGPMLDMFEDMRYEPRVGTSQGIRDLLGRVRL